MAKTRIEKFAEEYLGITMTPAQIEVLEAAVDGKEVIRARTIGITTAREVARAWLKHGLELKKIKKASTPNTQRESSDETI